MSSTKIDKNDAFFQTGFPVCETYAGCLLLAACFRVIVDASDLLKCAHRHTTLKGCVCVYACVVPFEQRLAGSSLELQLMLWSRFIFIASPTSWGHSPPLTEKPP